MVSSVFDGYPETLSPIDNTNSVWTRHVGHQEKKNVFLTNTANKQCVVNVLSTEIKKTGYNVLDVSDIYMIKLVNQSSLKSLINVID